MKLLNSLSQQLEDIKPIHKDHVGIYSCGPTVYSNLHIGNLSAFIYADVLRRAVAAEGYTVKHVMNITDIDDKTIRDSRQTYPDDEPLIALQKLTDTYTEVFKRDLAATGVDLSALTFISAVSAIPDMVRLIQRIADGGFAYATDDGIYFSIQAYQAAGHTYGLLQKVAIDHAKSRIALDEYDKDAASDFALWKAAAPHEPSWDGNFTLDGKTISMPGRPGWHIECSAMSEASLSVPFDIHTGGIDLKFPHHENEIAQTVAAGAPHLAKIFVHNNHILVNNRKMSKSLGNIITLREIEEKDITPNAFRMLVLESHYQNESNFSWDIIQAAVNRLKHWQAIADRVHQTISLEDSTIDFESLLQEVKDALANNLDTPRALSIIDKHIAFIESASITDNNRQALDHYFAGIETLLGLRLRGQALTSSQELVLQQRMEARQAKNWEESDRLRAELLQQGIAIKDSGSNQIWSWL